MLKSHTAEHIPALNELAWAEQTVIWMFNDKLNPVVSLCNLLPLFVARIDFTLEETTSGVRWTGRHFVLLIIIDRWSDWLSESQRAEGTSWKDLTAQSKSEGLMHPTSFQSCLNKLWLNPSLIHKSVPL